MFRSIATQYQPQAKDAALNTLLFVVVGGTSEYCHSDVLDRTIVVTVHYKTSSCLGACTSRLLDLSPFETHTDLEIEEPFTTKLDLIPRPLALSCKDEAASRAQTQCYCNWSRNVGSCVRSRAASPGLLGASGRGEAQGRRSS